MSAEKTGGEPCGNLNHYEMAREIESLRSELAQAKADLEQTDQDARTMYAVFKDIRTIVKNAKRYISIEQLVCVFAPLQWEGDDDTPKWNDPLTKAEAALAEKDKTLARAVDDLKFVGDAFAPEGALWEWRGSNDWHSWLKEELTSLPASVAQDAERSRLEKAVVEAARWFLESPIVWEDRAKVNPLVGTLHVNEVKYMEYHKAFDALASFEAGRGNEVV